MNPATSTSSSKPARARSLSVTLCVFWLASLIGCQTERVTTSDGWQMPPAPRQTPQPPPSLRADTLALFVGSKPDDTNNNGFPDTIRATVALFSNQHPTSLREDGVFVFMLFEQGRSVGAAAQPLAQWRMEVGTSAGVAASEQQRGVLAMAQYGPCYQFSLNLLDTPLGDRLAADRADLVCRFEPADGAAAIQSSGVRTLQIGRR